VALEALLNAQVEMKACAFEASNGQAELDSMDDLLPLFVFLLLRSNLRAPLACAGLLQDALTADQRLDREGRAVILLDAAARYVAEEWDVSSVVNSRSQHCQQPLEDQQQYKQQAQQQQQQQQDDSQQRQQQQQQQLQQPLPATEEHEE